MTEILTSTKSSTPSTDEITFQTEETDTKLLKTTTSQIRTNHITKWYTSDEKKDDDDQILCRVILWDDCIPIYNYCDNYYEESSDEEDETSMQGGLITFYIYDRTLYDRIFKYFNLHENFPSSFMKSLDEPLEFKLSEKRSYVTEWTSQQGTIKSYHRWYCRKRLKEPGTSGKIEITIDDNKKLFDKFVAYVLKFIPDKISTHTIDFKA